MQRRIQLMQLFLIYIKLRCMKIGLVSPYDLAMPGGVNQHIIHLVKALNGLGHSAKIVGICSKPALSLPELVHLPGKPTTFKSGGSNAQVCLNPMVFKWIKSILEEAQFDLIHLHNPLTPLINFAFLYFRPNFPQTTFIGTFHEYRSTPNPLIEFGKPFWRHWLTRLNGRITVSPDSYQFNTHHLGGQYEIIPNGVAEAFFQDDCGLRRDHLNILFVGRMERRKGLPVLLEAMPKVVAEFPNVNLHLVGPISPVQKTAVIQKLNSLNIQNQTNIHGQVDEQTLVQFYKEADLFCAPSIDYESFGIVLLEAMAGGCAIIASDIPGYNRIIQNGVQGYLVSPKSPTAIAEKVKHLLANAKLRNTMKKHGKATANGYRWEKIAPQILRFYEKTIEERNIK
ncbi:MAG: glycosyltransferase family 4 protein [Chloroflexota bacterium]